MRDYVDEAISETPSHMRSSGGELTLNLSWQFKSECAPLVCMEVIRETLHEAIRNKGFGPFQMAFENNLNSLGVHLANMEVEKSRWDCRGP